MLQVFAAVDKNRGIGTQAGIPWNIPKDRAYFKRKTFGQTVMMGYKTYHTLSRPLPNRQNIVLTSREKLREGFIACRSITVLPVRQDDDVWVIGGQQVYESLLPYTTKVYLTIIDADFGCNRFFPEYNHQFKRTHKSKAYKEAGLVYWYEVSERRT